MYLPAISIISLLWLGVRYEIVHGRINPLVLAAFGAPVIRTASNSNAITDNIFFANNLIAYSPCPNCEVETRFYYADKVAIEATRAGALDLTPGRTTTKRAVSSPPLL